MLSNRLGCKETGTRPTKEERLDWGFDVTLMPLKI